MICVADVCDCYACGLRRKGVQISPSATPSRTRNRPQPFRPRNEPSYEKGVVGEHRPDGSFMPVLRPGTTEPMPVHMAMGQRTRIDDQIRSLKSNPYVFNPESR